MKINLIDVGSCGRMSLPWRSDNLNYIDYCLKIDPRNKKNRKEKRCFYYKCAANDVEGTFPLYICSKEFNSSLFKPNRDVISSKDINRFIVDRTEYVKCRRLENIISEIGIDFDFIKIDTQGSDLAVLKGMGDRIDSIVAIHLEAYFIQMYEDMPLLKDIDEYLISKNFKQKCSLRKRKNVIFDDFLYLKSDLKSDKLELIKKIYNVK